MADLQEIEFELVDLFGQTALFTPLRIDPATVPQGLFQYELRHGDEDDSIPATMEARVRVNHFGTILCACDFGLQKNGAYVQVGEEDFGFSGEEAEVAEYLEEFEKDEEEPLPTVRYSEEA